MAFWNKKKSVDDEAEAKKTTSLSDELSDEMRAITEALEETQNEKEAKAKARAEENERMLRERQAVEEKSLADASSFVEKGFADGAAFFMMVEAPADLEPSTPDGLLLEGTVYGVAKKGEEVFIYTPDNKTIKSSIVDIRPEPGSHGDEVSNKRCILEIDGKDIDEIGKFSVISNKEPSVPEENKQGGVFNPRLLGLSLDFNRFVKDNDYFSSLVNAVIRANYLTHAKMDKDPRNGKPRIGIMSLTDPDDPDKRFIPVFTDDVSMTLAGSNIKESDIQKMCLGFPQLAKFATTTNHAGFVINPFGPVAMKIPNNLIADILKNPDFKKIFPDEPQSKIPTIGTPGEGKVQIAIGVPIDNPEYKAVSSGILKQCNSDARIHKAGIVMKMMKGKKEVSYLCVVDCDKGTENDCFRALFAAAKSGLSKGRKLEFLKYEEAPFADEYFSQQKWLYQE